MITRVEIKNYRSIAHADVKLGPLTVLVGRNGSGKSSFVDALKFVRDALQIGLENAVNARGGFGSIRRFGAPDDENVEIAIEVEGHNVWGRYEISLSNANGEIYVQKEKAHHISYGLFTSDPPTKEHPHETQFERQGENWISKPAEQTILFPPFSGFDQIPSLESNILVLPTIGLFVEFHELKRALSGHFHSLFPNTLREPQKKVEKRELSNNGDNFLSVLQNLISEGNIKSEIVNSLSRVTEGVIDLRVRGLSSYLIGELLYEVTPSRKDEPWFDLSQESDGTLRMLGLLTALYQWSEERALLALEEPEMALHPGALAILSDEIKAASQRRQVLITTQSPDLIARFPAADLRVVERRAGVTHIAPLDETQLSVIEDQLFDAGELLRSEGLRGARG